MSNHLHHFDPIDELVEQFDKLDYDPSKSDTPTTHAKICDQCHSTGSKLYSVSCHHVICFKCLRAMLKLGKKNCPKCQTIISASLLVNITEDLKNPLNQLLYAHDFKLGERVWYYSGNHCHWLYYQECCGQLTKAYDDYLIGGSETTEINIIVNGQPTPYVIDFDDKVQYPKNTPLKKRAIGSFLLQNSGNLKQHNIIGIAGHLLDK